MVSANCAVGTREDGDNESAKGGDQQGAVGGWRKRERETVEKGQLITFLNSMCPSPRGSICPCHIFISFDWLNKEEVVTFSECKQLHSSDSSSDEKKALCSTPCPTNPNPDLEGAPEGGSPSPF